MDVNLAHWHLLLNHFPIIGMIIGLALFLASFVGENEDLRRASFIIFTGIGFLSIGTFLTGFGAQAMITGKHGISDALIQRHEGSAMLTIWFIEITGALAAVGLWQYHRLKRPAHWTVSAILLFSLLSVGLVARTGNTGGDINHPELRATDAGTPAEGAPITEGPIGSFLRHFEPTPDGFSGAIIDNKWLWAFLMAVHFIGLAMIVGTVGILDLRMMGFLKQLPMAPVHRFMPWAMAGLAANILTGLLAFIGQPENYIYSGALWLKILALMLLGVNAAVFYLTGIFNRVNPLKAGEDAPFSARLIAVSSLFLWFVVITFGRYIQPLSNTVRLPGAAGPN
jgi:uncharacterized membrane protein